MAFLLTHLMSKLLFSVSAFDPAVFASVTAVLLGVALAAAYIPAKRTSRLDPVKTLRCD